MIHGRALTRPAHADQIIGIFRIQIDRLCVKVGGLVPQVPRFGCLRFLV